MTAQGARAQIPPTQSTTVSEDALAVLAPIPHSPNNPLTQRSREYAGVSVGDWVVYPIAAFGGGFDSNVVWSSSQPVAAVATKVAPSITATNETAEHKTVLFGDAEVRVFPTVGEADSLSGRVGATHVWNVAPDLTIKAWGEYDHVSTAIGAGAVVTPWGVSNAVAPLTDDRLTASISVKKTFGRAFVGVAYETTRDSYSSLKTSSGWVSERYRDSWVNAVTVRGGVWVSPEVYAFAEATGNLRDYIEQGYTSKGYRVVAGVGSDRISLFRGEVFGGVQKQTFDQPLPYTDTSPVIGGKLFWYPRRDITVRAQVDETFTDANLATPGNPNGHPARSTSAQLSVEYLMLRNLMLTAR
ncbi:MAG: outer membrane beta-barrel protein, partial [Hyphomicrobiales bacterium]|nr:outer membrane beta-barrel protein [Hyphomicrobiales bacterium]